MYGWAFRALLFVLSSLVLLELLFRFAVPADQRPASARIADTWVTAFDRSWMEEGYTSIGRVPTETFHWSINPQGWNSTVEYVPPGERDRPLIALVGDSHVENLQSDVEESIAAQLQDALGDSCLVYSFGKADQPLVQDLVVMRYVDSLYSPDAFVIVAGGDVVRRSIVPGPGAIYAHMQREGDGFRLAPPAERTPSGFARTALQSALVRYVRFNMAEDLFPLYRTVGGAERGSVPGPERADSLMPHAAEWVLDRMSEEYGGRGVLLVSNHFVARYRIYGGAEAWKMRGMEIPEDYRLLEDLVTAYPSIRWLDTSPAFAAAWERDHRRFECPDGKHLNGYGNGLVAGAIARRLEEDGTLDRILRR